jgi:redox-sensing transcriptional repressor
MQDSGLTRYGLEIVAGFDVDQSLVGTLKHGLPVYPVEELVGRCRELGAGIGIITVPVEHAQSVADRLVEAGVKAIWNFTPIRICAPGDVVISNTSIYAHLAVMYNRMNG